MRIGRPSRRAVKWLGRLLAVAVISLPAAAHVGEARARQAPEIFARGFGSKAAALGNSFVSIADDASAVFWNPAGTGWIPRKTITFSLTDMYFTDVDYSSVSYVHPIDRAGALGFSLTRWSVEGIEKRDDNNVLLGDDVTDTQMEILATYSSPPIKSVTVALGLKLDTQAMEDERALGAGLNLGLLYRRGARTGAGGSSFNAGLSLRNLVQPVLTLGSDRTTFPTRAVFSTSYGGAGTRYIDDWTMSVDFNAPSNVSGSTNFGVEASIRPVSFRAGSLDGRMTAGVGTVWGGISFDYAYSGEDFGRLHTFSLGITFGDPSGVLVSKKEPWKEKPAAQ